MIAAMTTYFTQEEQEKRFTWATGVAYLKGLNNVIG